MGNLGAARPRVILHERFSSEAPKSPAHHLAVRDRALDRQIKNLKGGVVDPLLILVASH
jgi:hypothetical protein